MSHARKSAPKGALLLLAAGISYVILRKMNSEASLNSSDEPSTTHDTSPTETKTAIGFLSGLTTGVTDLITSLMNPTQTAFLKKMTPIAKTMNEKYGIHPLIVMTQAAHESGWGASGLTKKANNLYGYTGEAALKQWLKDHALPDNATMDQIRSFDLTTAPFIILQTHEYVPSGSLSYFSRPGDLVSLNGNDATVLRPFRRYDSWDSSVEDWIALMKRPRYASAWVDALKGDMSAFAEHVYEAGYATDKEYPAKLVAVASKISDIASA